MRQTPCELILWHRLPAIRRELAIALVSSHGLSQRDAAEKLGLTPAAVCQYLSNRRGQAIMFTDSIKAEIAIAAANIMHEGSVATETCRLCRLIQETDIKKAEDPSTPRSPHARP